MLCGGLQELRWMRQRRSVVSHQGEKTLELSSKQRQERVKRTEWVPSKFARVCSHRFVSDMYATL